MFIYLCFDVSALLTGTPWQGPTAEQLGTGTCFSRLCSAGVFAPCRSAARGRTTRIGTEDRKQEQVTDPIAPYSPVPICPHSPPEVVAALQVVQGTDQQ